MPVNDKRCRKCGQTKPIRFFTLPRHRMCTRCRTRGQYDLVDEWLANQPVKSPVLPSDVEVWAAEQANALQPGARVPKLTMTWDGYKKYERERQRQIRREKVEEAAAFGQPIHTPKKYRKIKLCVRCRERKHASMFRSPQYRICAKCDGPPIV